MPDRKCQSRIRMSSLAVAALLTPPVPRRKADYVIYILPMKKEDKHRVAQPQPLVQEESESAQGARGRQMWWV